MDRRGRLTTVYRNLAHRVARSLRGGPQRPAAALPQPSVLSAEREDRLPEVKVRGKRELMALTEDCAHALEESGVSSTLAASQGPLVGSLALDLIEDGKLTPEVARLILDKLSTYGMGHVADALRVAERLIDHGRKYHLFDINGILRDTENRSAPSITTTRELESAVAAVALVGMLRAADAALKDKGILARSLWGTAEYLADPALDELIRRRPADLERIAGFLAERTSTGGHPEAADVEEWLDSEQTVLADGWL